MSASADMASHNTAAAGSQGPTDKKVETAGQGQDSNTQKPGQGPTDKKTETAGQGQDSNTEKPGQGPTAKKTETAGQGQAPNTQKPAAPKTSGGILENAAASVRHTLDNAKHFMSDN